MNRRWTFIVGGAVAVVLFAVMALVIRGTGPWTADAVGLAQDAHSTAVNYGFAADAVASGGDPHLGLYSGDAHAVAQGAHDLVGAQHAPVTLEGKATALDEALAAVDAAAPTEAQLRAVADAAATLAGDLDSIADAVAAGSDSANDQGPLVDTMFKPQVLALEVLGILLTAAMIGALVIARPLEAAADESHYSHPTAAQVAESDRASDPATHALSLRQAAGKEAGK